MKIVNLETFRKMPDGTVFCKYSPCSFGDSEMFGGDCGGIDFISAELTGWVESEGSDDMYDILVKAQETGESFKLDTECYGRDGLYENDQLFAIYETEDVVQLIETLRKALPLTQ